ncbi:MAG: hypothetical protein IKW03_07275 [Clostridia bacterium]|nr:hypothetical protein [Clostridia bacterium]
MKKIRRYLSLLVAAVICVLSITAVPCSAIDDIIAEDISSSENDDKPAIPFVLNEDKKSLFTKDGNTYTLYAAELTIDFNNDGNCTAAEARTLLRIAANLEKFHGDLQTIDVSRDGKITATDARSALRYSARLDTYYFDIDYNAITGFVKNSAGKDCYFDANGVLATGVKNIDGVNYYFATSGEMKTGLVTIQGEVYFFEADGKGADGEKTVEGKKYLFRNGKAKTGLVKNGDWFYYYDENGVMQTGTFTIDGNTYIFDATGKGKLKPKDPSEFKTAMIGDSIVATIGLYNVTDYIDFYGKVSLNSYSIFNKKISGSSRYVIDEIKDRGYDKVIILMGINEYGANVSAWKAQYKKIVDAVRVRAPGAEIYIHAILPINDQRAAANGYTVKNAILVPMNNALKALAKEENVKFIDAREVLADANGSLPYNAASDGIHLNKTYCEKWGDWLLEQICK